jgi:hypothetical protein
MVKMWQDVGAETFWKNRSHIRSDLVTAAARSAQLQSGN